MDTLMFSYNPLEYLLDQGIFHCMSCTPRVDVKADGSDQKVTGYPYDTLMVRVVSASSVEFIQKKNGSPTFACREIVSPDGNTKTEEFSETPTTQPVTGKAVFIRRAKGPWVRMRSRDYGKCKLLEIPQALDHSPPTCRRRMD